MSFSKALRIYIESFIRCLSLCLNAKNVARCFNENSKRCRYQIGFVLCLCATPSHAQTTAEAFLQGFLEAAEEKGAQVTMESRLSEGENLSIENMVLSLESGPIVYEIDFGDVELRAIEDANYDLTLTFPDGLRAVERAPDTSNIAPIVSTYQVDGLKLGFEGASGAPVLRYFLDRVTMHVEGFDVPDSVDTGNLELVIKESEGEFQVGGAGGWTESWLRIADLSFHQRAGTTDSEAGGEGRILGIDLNLTGDADLFLADGPEAFLQTDGQLSTEFRFQSGHWGMMVDTAGKDPGFSATFGTGWLEANLDGPQFDYSYSLADLNFEAEGGDLPFPVGFAVAETGGGLAMPLGPADEPLVFAMETRMIDATISDAVWDRFDPEATIPRDPMTLVLDFVSAARMEAPLGSKKVEKAGGDMPLVLEDFDLRQFRVAAGGAEIVASGSGVSVEDNPVGKVSVNITGALGLLDKLVGAGLITPQQRLLVRGGTGMFLRPGPEPDTFTTELELTAEGTVTANGIPLESP